MISVSFLGVDKGFLNGSDEVITLELCGYLAMVQMTKSALDLMDSGRIQ